MSRRDLPGAVFPVTIRRVLSHHDERFRARLDAPGSVLRLSFPKQAPAWRSGTAPLRLGTPVRGRARRSRASACAG